MENMRVYIYSGEDRKIKVRGSNMKDLFKHIKAGWKKYRGQGK